MFSSDALETAHLIDRLERLARAGEQVDRLNPAQWDALRYLARANRFSRNPGALADYLASTRGTVSRTLMALEAKGYVSREPSLRDGRGVQLALTRLAETALKNDPLFALAGDIERAAGPTTKELVEGLRQTFRSAVARNNGRPFGACFTCRHFRGNVRPSESESRAICVEQEPALSELPKMCNDPEHAEGRLR